MSPQARTLIPETYLHSQLACLHGCLRFVGVRVTPGWLFGITGQAFLPPARLGVGVRGSSARPREPFALLGRNLGAEMELLAEPGAVRAAINAGAACYGVGPRGFFCLTGYGDQDNTRVDRGGRWDARARNDDTPQPLVVAVRQAAAPDDPSAIGAGIRFALSVIEDQAAAELRSRARPASALEPTDWRLGVGRALGIVQECRGYAVEFMWEAKERLRGRLAPLFNDAAEQYDRAARALAGPFADGPEVAAITRARDADSRAVEALRGIIAAL